MKTILLTCITNTLYIQHTKSEKAKYFYLVHSLIPVTGLSAVVLWDRVQVTKLCNINKILYHYVLRQQSGHGHTCKCYSCLDITVNEVQIGIPVHTSTLFYCLAQPSFNMAVDTLDQYIGLLYQNRPIYWDRLTLLTYYTSHAVEDWHFFLKKLFNRITSFYISNCKRNLRYLYY